MITKDGFFYPILTQLMDSFPFEPFNTAFLYLEIPEYAEM